MSVMDKVANTVGGGRFAEPQALSYWAFRFVTMLHKCGVSPLPLPVILPILLSWTTPFLLTAAVKYSILQTVYI